MHNRALHDSLASFVEEAAWQLAEEVSGGAEVPFELLEQGRATAPLYCYRPLTGRFIAERVGVLARLPSYAPAAQQLGQLPDLPGYLTHRGRKVPKGDARGHADATLQAFLAAVWEDATEFVFERDRFEPAYAELEEVAYAGCTLSVVLTPVDGLVIESDEVPLGDGLSLVRAHTIADPPPGLTDDMHQTVAVLALDDGAALELAGRKLRRLQTALRLWDDAEPALGPTAYARTDGSAWMAIALATGVRRTDGDCLLAAEEEDPLRAFCALIARRTPRAGELAWALRRFELGCERGSAVEALTDWLLAARALLGDPEGQGLEHVAERLSAICGEDAERRRLQERIEEAMSLERAAVVGFVRPTPAVEGLVCELGGCLRALLRDVLCGHLEPGLRRLADRLLADASREVV
jgi:hypothetical protein